MEAKAEIAGYCDAVFAYHCYAGAAIWGALVNLWRGLRVFNAVLMENGELCEKEGIS